MKVTALARTRAFLPLALVLFSTAAHASDIKFQTGQWSFPRILPRWRKRLPEAPTATEPSSIL